MPEVGREVTGTRQGGVTAVGVTRCPRGLGVTERDGEAQDGADRTAAAARWPAAEPAASAAAAVAAAEVRPINPKKENPQEPS